MRIEKKLTAECCNCPNDLSIELYGEKGDAEGLCKARGWSKKRKIVLCPQCTIRAARVLKKIPQNIALLRLSDTS
jgi:hypothetical protein